MRMTGRPRDLNKRAASIVAEATGEHHRDSENVSVLSGRRGGLKGGPARAQKLSAERRTQIARKAAKARWERKRFSY